MNVIFISMDTLRADRLSCLGYNRGLTPNLDRIASQGSLFTQAYASDIPTQPSHTAIFTGCFGVNTGVVSHYHQRTQLDESVSWLPTIFQDKGYATGAVDHLFSMKGWFVRGYTDYMSPPGRSRSPGSVINDIGFRWIDDKKDEDIFLFLHFWDPHIPYVPPPAYRDTYTTESSKWTDPLLWQKLRSRPTYPLFTRNLYDHLEFMPNLEYISDLYDAEVAYLDFEIGRLFKKLEELGIIDNTMVVLFGDHGENMTEHDAWFDHAGLYDSVVHVPLILWAPGLVPKAKVSELVQLIDVKPTVLEMLGLPQVAGLDGMSLVPLMEGQTSTHRDAVYLSESTWQAKRGLRTDKWKYIRSMDPGVYPRSEDELYDLENDPGEQTNVAFAHPDIVSQLDTQLGLWLDGQLRGRPDPMRQVVEDGLPAVVRLDGIIDAPDVKEVPTGELPVVGPETSLPQTEPAIAVSEPNSLAEQSETALVPSTLPTASLMIADAAAASEEEKRKVRRRRAVFVTVAAILAVIALIFAITSILSHNVQAAGQLQPMQSVDLNFQSSAPIQTLWVTPGQSVHKGQVLATQSSTALTSQYDADVTKLQAAQVALASGPTPNQTPAQLQAAVTEAQAALTTAKTKASSQANLDGLAVTNANSQITAAQSNLATDQASVTSACSPGPQGSTDACDSAQHQLGVDQAALTSDQNALKLAQQTQSADAANSQAAIAQAQSALDTAQTNETAGTQPQSPSQVSTEQAAVNAAQAAVAADQKAINATQIYAPFSGIVAAVNGAVGDLAGPTGIQQSSSPTGVSSNSSSGIVIFPQAPVNSNSKTPQQLSLITLNSRPMNVVVQVGESNISNVHVGQSATVTFPAESGAVYQAKVSYIEPAAVNDNGSVSFLVHLRLVSSKGRPLPAPSRLSGLSGLSADVTFN